MGQGGVGRCTQNVQTAWPCLGSALETPWLAPGEPFLSSYAQIGWKTVLSPYMAPISGREGFLPGCKPRAVTIAGSLMGGCGLSHRNVENGCKVTCVKFGGLQENLT